MKRTTLALAALLALGPVVRADTLWIASTEGTAALEVPRVTVTDIQGDSLIFRGLSGGSSDRLLRDVVRIQSDSEPALSAAEEAFAAQQWDAATDQYLRTLKTSVNKWAQRRAAERLLESADKTNRFDASVAAYLTLVRSAPASARKPPLPERQSSYLDSAVTEVTKALEDKNLTADQRRLMLSLLVDLYRARDDQTAAAEAIQAMLDLGALDASDPAAAEQLVRLRLDMAGVAVDAGEFQKAIDAINANRPLFTDPYDQAEALWHLAEAQYGLARQSGDAAALKDAGIAYMRVVAHFKDLPGHPHVPEALMKAALVHEQLNEPETALQLYRQTASQYNDTPAGPKARQAADRLQAGQDRG